MPSVHGIELPPFASFSIISIIMNGITMFLVNLLAEFLAPKIRKFLTDRFMLPAMDPVKEILARLMKSFINILLKLTLSLLCNGLLQRPFGNFPRFFRRTMSHEPPEETVV